MQSADRVLPEFQQPELGETINFGSNRMRLARLEPEHVLVWRSEDGNWVWACVLEEHDGHTRLISRNRFRIRTLVARIGVLPMEPASLVMERKMLRGIKQRAERLVPPWPESVQQPADLTSATHLFYRSPRATSDPRILLRITGDWAQRCALCPIIVA
jgi:hypothetical protein